MLIVIKFKINNNSQKKSKQCFKNQQKKPTMKTQNQNPDNMKGFPTDF